MRSSILTVLALLPLTACTAEAPQPAPEAVSAEPSAEATEHPVICGCALEHVGHCSEWIEVDGQWVALELPVDLGSMPFCRKDGLVARVDGAVEGEGEQAKFVATGFALVD